MKLKKETDYALRIMLHLVLNKTLNKNNVITSKSIANIECIPEHFCIKILKKLANAKIITIHRGILGGYTLLKDSNQITLKEIIQLIEKDTSINECIHSKKNCSAGKEECYIRETLIFIQNTLFDIMENITFSDIINANISKK